MLTHGTWDLERSPGKEQLPTALGSVKGLLGPVISIGRLDAASEGLLLLTNDGMVARFLEHPNRAVSEESDSLRVVCR